MVDGREVSVMLVVLHVPSWRFHNAQFNVVRWARDSCERICANVCCVCLHVFHNHIETLSQYSDKSGGRSHIVHNIAQVSETGASPGFALVSHST